MDDSFTFTTDEEPCPYLPRRAARNEVMVPGEFPPVDYDDRLALGWRRFGRIFFRPACTRCRECVPVRVPIADFHPSRSQRRVRRRNRDVEVEIGEPALDARRLDLYEKFHRERARSRGWPTRSIDAEEYTEIFVDNAVPTLEFRYRIAGCLVGVAYVGEGREALNSVYAFFDPLYCRRSLGTFDILEEIDEARRRGKRHLYLGFLVSDCPSMAYKASFRPHETLGAGGWEAPENGRE